MNWYWDLALLVVQFKLCSVTCFKNCCYRLVATLRPRWNRRWTATSMRSILARVASGYLTFASIIANWRRRRCQAIASSICSICSRRILCSISWQTYNWWKQIIKEEERKKKMKKKKKRSTWRRMCKTNYMEFMISIIKRVMDRCRMQKEQLGIESKKKAQDGYWVAWY